MQASMLLRRVLLLTAAVLVAPLFEAAADTVYLKNGKTLEGEVIKDDGVVVIVRVTDGEVKLRAEDVEAIERESPLETKLRLARRQMQLGNLERAVALCEEIWRDNRNAPEARRTLAGAYALQGRKYKDLSRFAEARAVFEKLQQLDPKNEFALPDAARALAELQALRKDADEKVSKARALAVAGEWNKAIAAFKEAAACTPDLRSRVAAEQAQCHVERARERARAGRVSKAAADIEAALQLDPALSDKLEAFYASCALPEILASLGRKDLVSARSDLKHVLEVAPLNKSVLYVSGLVEEAQGNIPAAAAAYAQALRTRAASQTAEYAKELRRRVEESLGLEGGSWKIDASFAETLGYAAAADGPAQKLGTEHFSVVYYNAGLAQEVGARAEAARERILSALGLEGWKGQARFFLHRTQAEYTSKTGQPGWAGGSSRVVGADRGLAALEIDSWQTSPRLLTCVLPHEIAHLVIYSNMTDPARLPMCLHEGFAVLMEPHFRAEYYLDFLRTRLQSQDFIPLPELLSRTGYPPDPEFFYAEGFGLLEYVIQQKGLEAAVKMFKNIAAQGDAGTELLRTLGAPSLAELETQWKAWILKPK